MTKRLRFRFDLRGMLAATAILGAVLGLSMKEYRRVSKEREILAKLRAAGGSVGFFLPISIFDPKTHLRRIFGDDGFATDYLFSEQSDHRRISDEDLQILNDLPRLTHITFVGPSFTDESLSSIKGCTALQSLILSETQITAAGLTQLTAFPNLERLDLEEMVLSVEGLQNLKHVPRLGWLRFINCQMSNAALRHVSGLRELAHLEINGCNVNDAGIALLSDLPELFRLELLSPAITGKGLTPIIALPKLEVLVVLPSAIDDNAIESLRHRKTIWALLIEQGISDDSLRDLQRSLPGLEISVIDERKATIRRLGSIQKN